MKLIGLAMLAWCLGLAQMADPTAGCLAGR
jgi:hypothetical protein